MKEAKIMPQRNKIIDIPGHRSELHVSFLDVSPLQGVPPFDASFSTFRVEVLMPPPQDLEHFDHSL